MAGPADAVEVGAIGPEDVESCVAAASSSPRGESSWEEEEEGGNGMGRPPVKRRGHHASAEEAGGRCPEGDGDAAGHELASLSTSSSGAVRSGPEVALAFAKYLKTFAWVYVYSSLVELLAVVAVFLRAKLEGQVLKKIMVSIIYSTGKGASIILMQGMTSAFALAAGHHFSKAGNPPRADAGGGGKRHVGKHVEKGVIYLCPLFNTLGLTMMFAALLKVINAAIVYPEISAVVAMSFVFVAAVWVLGYPIFMRWYRRSEWSEQGQSKGLNIRGLLVATREERGRIPPFIRFWLRQVVGRPELQKDGDTGESGGVSYVWDGLQGMLTGRSRPQQQGPEIQVTESYANVNFTEVQIHLLRLLPNAMWQCTNLVFLRVYTSSLLLMTELIVGTDWGRLLRSFVDVIRYCIVFTLIVAGAYLFEAAVHDRHRSDIQNLIKAFLTLQAMFRRLSFMFTLTATIELISIVVGLVQLYNAS